MTEEQAEVVRLRESGHTIREISDITGRSYNAVKCLWQRAQKWRQDPAIQSSMDAVGTSLVPALAWAKTKSKDGTSYSVLLKPEEKPAEEVGEALRSILSDVQPVPEIRPPDHADEDLCTVYPVADAHIGLRSWGKETGTDYDAAIAVKRIREGITSCIASSPPSRLAIILDVGDLTHADDNTNQTPRSNHSLDVDTRHYKTLRLAVEALSSAIEAALQKHEHVMVRILRGNHNENSYLAVMIGLAERYRNNPRVSVDESPPDFFAYEFGRVMIAAHHGDKANAVRLVLHMADRWPEMWGRTLHRFYFTGHLHHTKIQDVGGVQVEQLRAVTSPDYYADSHGYVGKAQLQGITYHRARGEVSRVKVSF